ncbi:MAG: nicotinate (nicotinamide) nucleotide adenylyltransferase [Lentisphaerae bacterium]|nr:nicotinate (nicotinamide) nucleotide adenylyltransferase [Lentisphaerota bacterium]
MPSAPPPASPSRPVGLLGGTFNPVHEGHLSIAREALRLFDLDAVWFIPCAVPPHKPVDGLASNADRLAMLRLAIAGQPRFDALPVEFDRPGISYTVDTVRELQTRHPATTFVFIIGADTLPELHTWRTPLELLSLIRIVTLARPGWSPDPAAIRLPPPWPGRLLADVRSGTPLDVSSRDIRARIAAGQPVSLVPEPVLRYIHQHNLYS